MARKSSLDTPGLESNDAVLRFAEELILLLVDKKNGGGIPVPGRSLQCALAGAVLMDLALENRIDTDLKSLFLIDSTPIGDDLLDPFLALIAQTPDPHDTPFWVNLLANPERAEWIRTTAIDRLVKRNILELEDRENYSVTRQVERLRRYPSVNGEHTREVELRVMTILFTDELPSPRDVMLIALVNACGIFKQLLSPSELDEALGKIELISKMDLIGRTVFQAIKKAGIPSDKSEGRRSILFSRLDRAKALSAIPVADKGGLPIAGNSFSLLGNPLPFLLQQYRKIGPVFRIRALSNTFTVIAGTEANKFIQRKGRLCLRNIDFYASMSKALGAHRFTLGMDGAEHFRLRKVMGAGYSRGYYLHRIYDAYGIIVQEMDDLPPGKPMSAISVLRRIVAKQIGLICTGVKADDYLQDLTDYVDRMLSITTLHLPAFAIQTNRMRRKRARIAVLGKKIVEAHQASPPSKIPDLIDDVLALHRSDPQFLPELDLLSACIGPFIAGLHTAASTAAFMLYELLRHPEIMLRVRYESDELLANGGPTAQKLQAMDVTHRVAMETLRLYQVAPIQVRTVVNSFEFGGYTIPNGAKVMFPISMPHLMSEYFPEPERFDIGRYSPGRAEHRVPGVYAPFGLGTHRCLGSGFTEVCLAFTIALVLHRVNISMHPPNYQLKTSYSTVAVPKSSFKIVLSPRN